jgi:hypothetical protein
MEVEDEGDDGDEMKDIKGLCAVPFGFFHQF